MLLVTVAEETYAIAAGVVREVVRHRAITPVPGAPAALPGILSQRGAILPVVDMRLVLGFGQGSVSRATRIVIVAHPDGDLALLVDAVLDLVMLPPDMIEPPPPALDPARARFLRGVARLDEHYLIVIDLGELIAALRDWT
jgi:purine-binding chemotaxis protein CheW